MSVMVLGPKVFNYIRAGIERAAYNRTVDHWYFYSLHYMRDKDIQQESLRLVKSLADLNELSYCGKYNDKMSSLSEFIRPTFTHKELTPLQFIKYVQCLVYNIEMEYCKPTAQQWADYQLLKKIEIEAMSAYINQQDEYKKAAWSED